MVNQLHLEVAGTGSYLPDEVIHNFYFTQKLLNKYDKFDNIIDKKQLTEESIVQLSGIRERRKSAANEFPSDMGYKAAIRAIENSGINASSLTGIVLASVTEDIDFPNGAAKIQKRLGVKNCFAYDVSNACAAFPEIIAQLNARVLRRPGNYLAIAAECLTKIVDYTDINSTLFGDGAGALILIPTESPRGILDEYSVCDPFDGKDEWIFRDKNRFLRMPEGRSVMKEAILAMVESGRVLKEKIGWDRADVYIPHQANVRILDGVEKKIVEEGAIVYKNIEKYGNMSAATCAVALDEALKEKVIKRSFGDKLGSRVIVTSFGGGLVTSAVPIQF